MFSQNKDFQTLKIVIFLPGSQNNFRAAGVRKRTIAVAQVPGSMHFLYRVPREEVSLHGHKPAISHH